MDVSGGFEKMCTNCDILIHIYKMLDFKDQLSLAQVSATLKSVFADFIWKVDYRTLTVAETFPDYLVANAMELNRVLLTADVFQEFLRFYAASVQELTSYSHLDIRQFKNLTSLRCCADICWMELIQSAAEYLPYLQRIHLLSYRPTNRHFFSHYIRIYMFGAMEDNFVTAEFVATLLKVKNLKRLCLDYRDEYPIIRIKYQHFCELVSQLKLEVLKLSFVVEPEEAVGAGDTLRNPEQQLKELDITTTFDPRKWSNSLTSFMQLFGHLSSLNVRMMDGATAEILAIIAASCQHLEKFIIQRTTFTNIEMVSLPPKLSTFYLEYCYGLTYRNLKQILSETTTIVEFISNGTWYKGEFEDFPISPSLQTLAINGVDMGEFRSAYAGNENLKHLTWLPSKESSNIPGVGLASCRNLETLDMKRGQMALDTLLQLKHLRKLTTWLMLPQQWPYVTALLKHPSLNELTIRIEETQTEAPAEGFPTGVTSLKLLYQKSFALDLDFWLDLFGRNANMKLAISPYPDPEDSLRRLINHPKFPKSLRSIRCFGFTLNCADLRRNFDVTVKPIRYDINEFDNPENEMYFIVLCKN